MFRGILLKGGKFVISGAVVGCIFDHHYESKNPYVEHGHRNMKSGSSIYSLISSWLIFPPTALVILPCAVWLLPGIILNQKIDQIMYPSRWDTDYRTTTYIKYIEDYKNKNKWVENMKSINNQFF